MGWPTAGEVDAYLMGAAGGRRDFDEREPVDVLADAVGRPGGPPALDDGHSLAVARVAADGAFDDAFRRLQAARSRGRGIASRPVAPSTDARGRRERGRSWRRAGGRRCPCRAGGRCRAAARRRRRKVAAVGEEGVDQGVARVPGRGMDGHAGRLVDDQEIAVLVDDAQGDGFGLDVQRLRRRDANVHGVVGSKSDRRAWRASR